MANYTAAVANLAQVQRTRIAVSIPLKITRAAVRGALTLQPK